MINKLFYILIAFIILSCSLTKNLSNKVFIFRSENRDLKIEFKNENTLIIKNTFYCDIDKKFQEIEIEKEFVKKGNLIIIKQPEPIDIPYFENKDCFFLSKEYRHHKENYFDGRTFYTDKTLYMIPKIDTLKFIDDNKLLFYKKTAIGSDGFLFREM